MMKPNAGISSINEDLMSASFAYGLSGSIVSGLLIWAIVLWLIFN